MSSHNGFADIGIDESINLSIDQFIKLRLDHKERVVRFMIMKFMNTPNADIDKLGRISDEFKKACDRHYLEVFKLISGE